MAKKTIAILDTETMPLHHFTEKAYLDYSMYVILDRTAQKNIDSKQAVII